MFRRSVARVCALLRLFGTVLILSYGGLDVAHGMAPQAITVPALRELLSHESGDVLVQFTSTDPNCGFCVQNNASLPGWLDRGAWGGRFLRVSWTPWKNLPADLPTLPGLGNLSAIPSLVLFRNGRALESVQGQDVISTERLILQFAPHPAPVQIPETVQIVELARQAIETGGDLLLEVTGSTWNCPACQQNLEDMPYRLARLGWKGRYMVLTVVNEQPSAAELQTLPGLTAVRPFPMLLLYRQGRLAGQLTGFAGIRLDGLLRGQGSGTAANPPSPPASPVAPATVATPSAGKPSAAVGPAAAANAAAPSVPRATPGVPASMVASLSVAPASVRHLYGVSMQLKAQAQDAKHASIPDVAGLHWTSSDPAVASVDGNGRVVLLKRGKATITVTAGQISATSAVEVTGFSELAQTSTKRACALPDDRDAVYCWGKNLWTIPLNEPGTVHDVSQPTAIARGTLPVGIRISHVVLSTFASCALSEDGRVFCWGSARDSHLLGREAGSVAPDPQALPPAEIARGEASPAVHFRAVGVGPTTACTAGDDQKLYCWGNGQQLPQTPARRLPARVPFPVMVPLGEVPGGTAISEIALSTNGGCVLAGGDVYCWSGSGLPTRIPTGERPVNSPVRHVDSDDFILALGDDGVAYASGSAFGARWGHGNPAFQQSRPWRAALRTDGAGFTALSQGGIAGATCGLDGNGQAWCWGKNHLGSAATGGTVDIDVVAPQPAQRGEIPGDVKLVGISCGEYHCATLGDDGRLYAWGSNEGQVLGRTAANFNASGVPILVAAPTP